MRYTGAMWGNEDLRLDPTAHRPRANEAEIIDALAQAAPGAGDHARLPDTEDPRWAWEKSRD
jgi:hypothetical protein